MKKIIELLSEKRRKNLYRKGKNLITRYQRKGLGFLRYNDKTLLCLDKGNVCPKDEENKPCAYCYKADIDHCYKSFNNGKRVYHEGNHVDLRLLNEFCREYKMLLIQYDRSYFSTRVFSFSDMREKDQSFWSKVLPVFKRNGLRLHSITKQYAWIGFLCAYCDTVNVSVDTLAEKANIEEAVFMKIITPNQIKIRSVELNQDDIEYFQDIPEVDIHTLYHGSVEKRDIENLKNYTHEEIEEKEREYGNYCCAYSGKCIDCMKCQ